jgi:hypothetical protein
MNASSTKFRPNSLSEVFMAACRIGPAGFTRLTAALLLAILAVASTGCGDKDSGPKKADLTLEETMQILDALVNSDVAAEFGDAEIVNTYEEGESWLVEVRQAGGGGTTKMYRVFKSDSKVEELP